MVPRAAYRCAVLRLQLGQLQHACAPGLQAPWLVPRHLSCTHGSHAPLIGCAELLGSADLAPGSGLSVQATGVKSCEGEASRLARAVLLVGSSSERVAADVCNSRLKGVFVRLGLQAVDGAHAQLAGKGALCCDASRSPQHMLGTLQAVVNNRKNKIIAAYELSLVLSWQGSTADGAAVTGALVC